MKNEPVDPGRWTTAAESPVEKRMGAALRVAATTILEKRSGRAPAVVPARPRRLLAALALAIVLLLALGTVATAKVMTLVRQAREAAWSAVTVPAGTTISIARRKGLRIDARGPLSVESDGDIVTLSGTGEARVESGSRAIEVVTAAGSTVHLVAGAAWPPSAPTLAPPPAPLPTATTNGITPPQEPVVSAPMQHAPLSDVSTPRRVPYPHVSAPLEPPPAAPSAPPPVNNDGEEAALVAAAFRALRSDHDPAAALALLDRHRSSFPAGALSVEAGMARVEALIALGRSAQALATLEALPATATPARLLLRGELRAANGHCASARDDLAAVEAGGSSDLAARARAAAAACADGTFRRAPTEESVEGTPR